MNIKTYKGYNNTTGVELDGLLTLDDFTIEDKGVVKDEYGDSFTWEKILTLKDEVVERLELVLPIIRGWRNEPDEPQKRYHARRVFRMKFQGCKNEEARERKREKTRQEALVWVADNGDAKIEKVIHELNETIKHKASTLTKEYTEEVVRVMSGNNMSDDFMKKHLDSPNLNERLDAIEEEMKKLRKERDEINELQKKSRNKFMLKYLEENGWNDDDEDNDGNKKVVIMDSLREKLTEMYKNEEGFSGGRFSPSSLEMFL